MPFSVADLMSRMPSAFLPEKAAGLEAVVQFKFTGAEAGDWYVTIKDGGCVVSQGAYPNPKLTLTADSGDIVKIFSGTMDGMQAFMQGKLRLTGDMGLAMKLMTLFKLS
jgi:putative sterol carrier protein